MTSISLSHVGLSERARLLFRLLGRLDSPDFAAWVAAALLNCSVEEGDPMAWFDDERPALIAVAGQACARSLDELAWDLAASMERYFDVRGFFDDCRGANEAAIELCRKSGNRLGEAVMLRGLLDVTTWIGTGREDAAMAELNANAERLVQMFGEIGEKRGLSDAHAMRAWGLAAAGRAQDSLEEARTALGLAEETGHVGGQARAHLAIAVAYGEAAVDTAIGHLREAGTFEDAHACLSRSLEICQSSPDPSSETLTLVALAKLYARQCDPRARRTAEIAESMSRQYNLAHHRADALAVLGALDLAEGATAAAIRNLEESVGLWRTRGWVSYLRMTLVRLADAYEAQGNAEAADVCRREAGVGR